MKFIYYPLVLLWMSIFGQVLLWFGQAKYTLYKWIEKKVSCRAVPLVNIYHQSAYLGFEYFCNWTAFNTSSWKVFWTKGNSSHFENSPPFQTSWTYSDLFQTNEIIIHSQLSAMLTCRDGKGGQLSSQASKML